MFGKLFKDVLSTVKKEVKKEVDVKIGSRYEYFAVIEKTSFHYNGEIKDIPLGRGIVNRCYTTDDLLNKLTAKLNEEILRCDKSNLPYPAKTPLETLKAQYPNREIIAIRATVKQ